MRWWKIALLALLLAGGALAAMNAVSAADTDGDGVPDDVDNCPQAYNPGQENTDSGPPPSGTGAIGNGIGILGDDATIPNGDSFGDACDDDLDNDGIANGSDPDPGGDITYDDNNNGIMCPMDGADDGPSWDANCNGRRDGLEASCPLAVNPYGDDDGDGLKNTWEVCMWGTNPAAVDSDGDGIGDCVEAADVNGDGIVDFVVDTLSYAEAALNLSGKDGDFDIDNNGIIDFGGDTLRVGRFALGLLTCQ